MAIPDEPATSVPGSAPSARTSQFEFGTGPTLNPELAMVRFQSKIIFPSIPSITQTKQIIFFLLFLGSAYVYGRGSRTRQFATTTATRCGHTSRRRSGRCIRTPTLRTRRRKQRDDLTALALSEGRATGPDNEMTEDCDWDDNLTEEVIIARAIEMSMRSEPESEEEN